MPFSITILTYNEEINIGACLASVSWADDIVVLDSLSTDRTCEIAREKGARVFQRAFDDFASQRNHALNAIDFKHDWVFHLDADERFNEDLRRECERAIAEDRHSAWSVPNRIIFLGKWIKHCTQYPYSQVRLVKRGEARFDAAGHGQKEANVVRGIGQINVPYDHYNFSKGLEDWIAKHNRYSSQEALAVSETRRRPLRECFALDRVKRKRALKSWFVHLPFRPSIKFLYLYVLCCGFLDGRAGLTYCKLQAIYETMIVAKVREIADQKR